MGTCRADEDSVLLGAAELGGGNLLSISGASLAAGTATLDGATGPVVPADCSDLGLERGV